LTSTRSTIPSRYTTRCFWPTWCSAFRRCIRA
jgi:hypothetical protein